MAGATNASPPHSFGLRSKAEQFEAASAVLPARDSHWARMPPWATRLAPRGLAVWHFQIIRAGDASAARTSALRTPLSAAKRATHPASHLPQRALPLKMRQKAAAVHFRSATPRQP